MRVTKLQVFTTAYATSPVDCMHMIQDEFNKWAKEKEGTLFFKVVNTETIVVHELKEVMFIVTYIEMEGDDLR